MNPEPQINEEVCAIFREWAGAVAEVTEDLSDTNPYTAPFRLQVLQALQAITELSLVGAGGTINLPDPETTYANVKLTVQVMEVISLKRQIDQMLRTAGFGSPSAADTIEQVATVRAWLASNGIDVVPSLLAPNCTAIPANVTIH